MAKKTVTAVEPFFSANELQRCLRLVVGALTKYANDEGWQPGTFGIFYRVNEDWGRVHIIFVSEHFDSRTEYLNYVGVLKYLKQTFNANADVLASLSLVTRSQEQVNQGGIYEIGPEYREYWTIYPDRSDLS